MYSEICLLYSYVFTINKNLRTIFIVAFEISNKFIIKICIVDHLLFI